MKLEQQHILPYLPFELKIEHPTFRSGIKEISVLKNLGLYSIEISHRYFIQISSCKPILKPLSDFDITEQLNLFSESQGWCEMYNEFFKTWFNDAANIDTLILQCPYEISQYFFKNHYDFFSLIPKKLAVSVHDIKKL